MNVPSIEPIFTAKRINQMGLSKALATLGFGTWSELESAENDKKSGNNAKSRIKEALNAKLADVEEKREKALLLEKKINKMPDGPDKRKLMYKKQLQDAADRKRKKTPVDEERALHESYQIVLKEWEVRRIKRESEMERLSQQKRSSVSQSVSEDIDFKSEMEAEEAIEDIIMAANVF